MDAGVVEALDARCGKALAMALGGGKRRESDSENKNREKADRPSLDSGSRTAAEAEAVDGQCHHSRTRIGLGIDANECGGATPIRRRLLKVSRVCPSVCLTKRAGDWRLGWHSRLKEREKKGG